MSTVHLLWHSRDRGEGETDDKLVGVYATRADAERARERALRREGFCDAPDGFLIDAYEVGHDHWEEGFVTTGYGA